MEQCARQLPRDVVRLRACSAAAAVLAAAVMARRSRDSVGDSGERLVFGRADIGFASLAMLERA